MEEQMDPRIMQRRDILNLMGLSGLSLALGGPACVSSEARNAGGSGVCADHHRSEGPMVGLCTIAFSERPLDEVLELAARMGCDGVELWGKPDHLPLTRSDPEVKVIRDKIEGLGLKGCVYGSYVRLGDGQEARAKDKDFDRTLQIAGLLGAPLVRIWAGAKNSELLTKEEWSRMVEDGRRFCDRAEKTGVTLALEMHPDCATNKARATVELIRQVGSPNLKANYQVIETEDSYERARIAAPYVVNAHAQTLSAAKERPLLADGTVDFRKIYRIFKPHGFKGFFEIEFVRGRTHEEKCAALAADLKYLRSIGA
jgi:3-dehydroshikimate dehydratase